LIFSKKKKKKIDEEPINEYDITEPEYNIDGDPIDPHELRKAREKAERKATADREKDNAGNEKAMPLKKRKAAFFISITAFVLVVLLIASYLLFTPDFKAFNGTVKGFFSSLISDSYPVSVDSDSVKHLVPYRDGFALLTDTNYAYYKSTGKVADSLSYGYSSPQIAVSGRNVLIYDRGDTKLTIKRGMRTDAQIEAPYKIITCDISKSGYYAIATLGDEPASVLTVYSDSGSKVFQWNCAQDYISAVSLSPNNKRAAVAVTGSKDAQLKSKIHVFDYKYNESYVSMDVEDVIIDLCYISSDRIFVVGKNNIYLLKDKVLTTVYSFTNDSLEFFSLSNDGLCILTKSGADTSENNVVRFDRDGSVKTKTKVTGKARGFSATDYYSAVLLSDSIVCIGYNGEVSGVVENIKYASRIAASNSSVYVVSVNSIDKFSAFADSSQKKSEHATGVASLEE